MTEPEREPSLLHHRQTMSGLEFFQRMRDGTLVPPAMVTLLGFRMIEVEAGHVAIAGHVTEQFYNGLGIAHGGYAATLLDTALGCAINSTQPAGRIFTTLELKINYTRPLTAEAGELRCDAHVVHVGSRTATAEARVVDAVGRIYAHATTTCMLV
jgi:uncharacterized protein (TIGR00369 family)